MADSYQADGEPYCSYGTTWLVLADDDQRTYSRVVDELTDDGWVVDESPERQRSGGGVMVLPALEVSENLYEPYVVLDSVRFSIELNAGLQPRQ